MALEHYDQSDGLSYALKVLDWIFVIIFLLEAILKITAVGWELYWASSWNKFDFIIVIIGIISVLDIFGGVGLNVLRLFRIARILRLINKAKTLKTLFKTLLYSIPSLWNIGLLIVVILFIFAVIGMNFFGQEDASTGTGEGSVNFDNF